MSTIVNRPFTIDLGDISLAEVNFKIGDNEFILKEASGEAACAYRNAILRSTELGPDGRPSKLSNLADTEPLLVSLCLFNIDGRRISVNDVKKWPNRIVKKLFDKAKEISELGEEAPERKQLEEALDSPGAPCSFKDLRKFVSGLPQESYGVIQTWMGPEVEETIKNERSSTGDGLS